MAPTTHPPTLCFCFSFFFSSRWPRHSVTEFCLPSFEGGLLLLFCFFHYRVLPSFLCVLYAAIVLDVVLTNFKELVRFGVEFYRVLPSFTEFSEFYRVLVSYTRRSCWILESAVVLKKELDLMRSGFVYW